MHWVFASRNIPGDGKPGGNRGGYRNPVVDDLLGQASSIVDGQRRAQLYQEVEAILATDLPYLSLWFENSVVVTTDRVQGFVPDRAGSLLGLAHVRVDDDVRDQP